MKKLILYLLVCLPGVALAQHPHSSTHHEKPAQLFTGLSDLHHPVSTRNADAQKYFDQGLALIYGFNHDEAARSFKQAAQLDANLAMAHWGVALAMGSNYNLPSVPEREKAAYEAIQKALALISKASDHERDYIQTLARRYSPEANADYSKLAIEYSKAMGELMKKYPDDLDAATLYAESLMNLNPWKLWTPDGKPANGTEEIIAVLESVLKRNPNHIGTNHYYIHAVEASKTPERGLASAFRLKSLAPSAGHLVHMPAHIHMRIGDYENAASANAQGADADRAYMKATSSQGFYPMMYYNHNVHFLAIASGFQGRSAEALKSAKELVEFATPHLKDMPMLDAFTPTLMLLQVRFQQWSDILKTPEPDKAAPYTNAIWHYVRGMAFTAMRQTDKADDELKAVQAAIKSLSAEASLGFNKIADVLTIAEHQLAGKIALAKKDHAAAVESFHKGITAEDALSYNEPADWYLPVRESLGAALLRNGQAAEAEKVFRTDLEKNPRNGRSLFGLLESLKAQGRAAAVPFVQREFDAAWKHADIKLKLEEM